MTARGDRDRLVLGRGRFVLGGNAQQTAWSGTTRKVLYTLYRLAVYTLFSNIGDAGC